MHGTFRVSQFVCGPQGREWARPRDGRCLLHAASTRRSGDKFLRKSRRFIAFDTMIGSLCRREWSPHRFALGCSTQDRLLNSTIYGQIRSMLRGSAAWAWATRDTRWTRCFDSCATYPGPRAPEITRGVGVTVRRRPVLRARRPNPVAPAPSQAPFNASRLAMTSFTTSPVSSTPTESRMSPGEIPMAASSSNPSSW
jgi:hypothetical protein